MGGGPYDPRDSRQTVMNEYHSQAPGAISPPFTGFGDMLDGAIQTQNWLPSMSPNDETRHHGRAEHAHRHYISDDLEELDNTDIGADANGSSPEAIVEPLPSLKRTRSQLASGPPSRRTLHGSSNQNEVKKVKACVRCRMQKMKVSHIFVSHVRASWFVFWQLMLCGSVNPTQRTCWEIA